jgi:hypothetical protein
MCGGAALIVPTALQVHRRQVMCTPFMNSWSCGWQSQQQQFGGSSSGTSQHLANTYTHRRPIKQAHQLAHCLEHLPDKVLLLRGPGLEMAAAARQGKHRTHQAQQQQQQQEMQPQTSLLSHSTCWTSAGTKSSTRAAAIR